MKINKYLLIILVTVFIFGLLTFLLLRKPVVGILATDDPLSQKLVSYQIIETDDALRKAWSLTDIFIHPSRPCPLIAAADGRVFVNGEFNRPHSEDLLAFEGVNGTLLWRGDKADGQSLSCLFATPKVLYSSSNGSGRVTAHDVATGQVIWSERMPQARYVNWFYIDNNLIYVTSSSGHQFVRAEDGEVLQSFQGSPTPSVLENVVTQLTLPSTEQIKLDYFDNAVFTEQILFTRTSAGILRAFDRQTGDRLWESEETVISNVVATETSVYLLTLDRKLLGLDPRTGEKIYSMKFKPSEVADNTDSPMNAYANIFYLALDANTGFLYAFFGDGAQLFAFEIV